ncbi:hypothetical protein QLX08_006332 [Tetragonisca angustula]|uniref:Uncharacterized protein n=2 Tax=Tetragonisca angustula TaxID=166442 RepID=A0AAW0ZX06_9HYME
MNKKRRILIVDPANSPKSIQSNPDWRLLLVCSFRHMPMAREALSQGANVNCRRFDYLTPLHIAVQHNDTELIQLLCNQPSINTEARIIDGLIPLHKATFLGHKTAVEELLRNNVVINCTDNLGRYPLHYAALRKDMESASLLLKNGANVNVYDDFHESPLYTSVIRRPFLPMINLLLSHGATVTSGPNQISLCLLLEAILSARSASDIEILDLLFRKGADVNTTDLVGLRTPLHIAAMTGNSEVIVYLIEKGADLSRKTRDGHTPMDIALMYRNFKAAQLIDLLSKELKIHRTSSITNF